MILLHTLPRSRMPMILLDIILYKQIRTVLFHRISWVWRHLKDHLVSTSMLREVTPHIILDYQGVLSTCRDGATFTGKPVSEPYNPHKKNFIMTSKVNLLSFSLKLLPLVLQLCSPITIPSLASCRYYKATIRSPLKPSLFQAEDSQLSQPFTIGDVLQPSEDLCGPPVDTLQQLHVPLALKATELDTHNLQHNPQPPLKNLCMQILYQILLLPSQNRNIKEHKGKTNK